MSSAPAQPNPPVSTQPTSMDLLFLLSCAVALIVMAWFGKINYTEATKTEIAKRNGEAVVTWMQKAAAGERARGAFSARLHPRPVRPRQQRRRRVCCRASPGGARSRCPRRRPRTGGGSRQCRRPCSIGMGRCGGDAGARLPGRCRRGRRRAVRRRAASRSRRDGARHGRGPGCARHARGRH